MTAVTAFTAYKVSRTQSDLLISAAIYNVVQRAESLLRGAAGTVALWHRRAEQRHAIAQLSDAVLADIGLTRWEAMLEAEKPFWIK